MATNFGKKPKHFYRQSKVVFFRKIHFKGIKPPCEVQFQETPKILD